jgi:DNA (cytosine-5)-methyltransferase 1
MNDQSRAQCWHILKWAQELYIENILIENVEEFQDYGPLGADGRPMKSKKGETFQAFVKGLESLDYRVEYRVLNAADFGDATTRKRLFMLCRRPAHRKIIWPLPSHTRIPEAGDLFQSDLKPWVAAKKIIDWSIEGESIFNRKRPLKKTTLERIAAGLRKFCGAAAAPFLLILRQHMDAMSIEGPLPALCAGGTHVGVVDPRPANGNGKPQPFLIPFYNERKGQKPRTHDVNEPIPSIPATGSGKFALIQPEPYIVNMNGKSNASSVGKPAPTQTTGKNLHVAQPEAFIVTPGGANMPNGRPVTQPMPTVMAKDRFAVVEPKAFVMSMEHGKSTGKNGKNGKRVYSMNGPMPTITSADAWAMAKPCLIKYNGTGKANSVDEPLDTVTAKDRFGLMIPGVGVVGLDIRFRMLRPHELAAAMGFPKNYEFMGTREQQVRQIGNAVACFTAKALCKALLED